MEWMISTTEFRKTDCGHFGFNSSNDCKIRGIAIKGKENVSRISFSSCDSSRHVLIYAFPQGDVDFQDSILSSVADYDAWMKRVS